MNEPDRRAQGPTVAALFAMRFRRAHVAFTLGALGAYVLVFFPTHRLMGPSAVTLALLPAAIAGWLLGMWAGLLVGLACFPLNILLLNLVGQPGWEVLTRTGGGALGMIFLILVGGAVGWVSDLGRRAARELTARQRAEEALRSTDAMFRNLVEQSLVGVYIIQEGKFVYVNPRLAEIFEYTPDELTASKSVADLVAEEDRARVVENLRARLQGEVLALHYTFRGQRKDGTTIDVEVYGTRTELKGKPAVIGTLLDITERKRAEQEIQRRAAEMSALQETALDLVSHLETKPLLETIIRRATDLLGVSGGVIYQWEEPAQQLRCTITHNLSRDYTNMTLRPGEGMAGRVYQTGQPLVVNDYAHWEGRAAHFRDIPSRAVISVPILWQNRVIGVINVNDESGARTFDDRDVRRLGLFANQAAIAIGNARLYTAVQQELAERKQTEEKLAAKIAELEQHNREIKLLNEMGDLLQSCQTVEETSTVVAQFAQELFPNESGALCLIAPSRNFVEAIATWGESPPQERVFTPDDCWALRRGQAHQVTNSRSGLVCRHVSQPLPAGYLCAPMMAQGETLGILHLQSGPPGPSQTREEPAAVMTSQQQLAATLAGHIALALANLKLREALHSQAIRDPLTGLFNRRYMEETLERELRRAERRQAPLGVILFDLDHFKKFNDTFGHAAGDIVLREIGAFLQTHVRAEDIACRYGGEEFTVILPEASLEDTLKRAGQLREGVKQLQVRYHDQALGAVTVSLGVAVFPEHGSTAEATLQAADTALYRAKREGRDRVAVGTTTEE